MTTINATNSKTINVEKNSKKIEQNMVKDDNIFANYARKAGMDGFANFLSDDWSANMARKMGFNDFADWIDNKPDENNKKDDGFFSNLGREMVKHPIITITAIVGTVIAGKSIYEALAKNKANAIPKDSMPTEAISATAGTNTVAKAPEITKVADNIPLKSLDDQISEAETIIQKEMLRQREIGYKDFEILAKLPENERNRIATIIELHKKEKDFMLFASGNKPGIFIGKDVESFDCLRNSKIGVAEFLMREKDANLLLNKAKTKKLVDQYKKFFIQRFEMPETTTTDEIVEMLSKGWNNKLIKQDKFADVRSFLNGSIEKNAIYSQIYQDMFNANKYRHITGNKNISDLAGNDLNKFKELLKEFVNSEKSSYKNLSQDLKQRVYDVIDSIGETEFQYKNLGIEYLFRGDEHKRNKLKALKNLAEKIEFAHKNGTTIRID